MERNISDDLITSENMSTTTVATVDLQEQVSATPGVVIISSHRSDQWGIGPFRFRFRLAKFRRGSFFAHNGLSGFARVGSNSPDSI